MTQRRIRWTVRTLRRLDEIGAYIEQDEPDAAARLVASVDMLTEMPAAGRIGRIASTREVVLSESRSLPQCMPLRNGLRGCKGSASPGRNIGSGEAAIALNEVEPALIKRDGLLDQGRRVLPRAPR